MTTGVYCIRQISTQRLYIGSTRNSFESRWYKHRQDLRKGTHHSPFLQNCWNKQGEKDFSFEILEECPMDLCILLEQQYLDTLVPVFNSNPRAGGGGAPRSEETRAKMSKAHKERYKNHPVSEETRQKFREARKNYKHSEATRQKLREAHVRSPRLFSEETRRKLSESGKKKPDYSEEHKCNMRLGKMVQWEIRKAV